MISIVLGYKNFNKIPFEEKLTHSDRLFSL